MISAGLPYLNALLNSTDDAVIATARNGTITLWNVSAERLFGYARKEIVGRPLARIIPHHVEGEIRNVLERVRRGKQESHFETMLATRDKRLIDISLTVCPIKDATRKVAHLLIIGRDIRRRKRGTEERLQRNRELLTLNKLSRIVLSPRSLAESCRDIVEEIRATTGFPYASIALYDEARQTVLLHGVKRGRSSQGGVLEVPVDEIISGIVIRSGKPLIETHVLDRPAYRTKVMRWAAINTFVGYPMKIDHTIIGSLNLAHTESMEIRPETLRWIESLSNYVAVLTERKRAEEELFHSQQQLRELSRHIQSGIEEERKRIARELHDQLGQELSLLQLELGLLQDQFPASDRDLRAQTISMTKKVDAAIHSVQRISTDLRPTILDNLGLGAAVDWAARQFQKRTRIRCLVAMEPRDVRLDPERSTALFRILQEAFTNVVRHSRATRVAVHLEKSERIVELRVRDNGVGIARERIMDPQSVGLMGMRERVRPWGGTVDVSGKRGKGTEIVVTIPWTT